MFGFLRRKIEEATLNAIFKVALEGMENFNFPGGLTNAGKFELLMEALKLYTFFDKKAGIMIYIICFIPITLEQSNISRDIYIYV